MAKLSVVIPAFNAVATVADTVRSVLAQTEPDFELIVVDDGSTDETAVVVERFCSDPRVSLVRQANRGTAGARNTGIARASAPYVSFLDNDDLWLPGYLAAMAGALDSRPDAGFAYCDAWGLDDATSRVHRYTELHYRPGPREPAPREQVLLALARANFVMSSATVRREVLEQVDGFDTSIRGTDDYDIWLRIVLAGWTAVRAGERPLLLQRGRHDSLSKDERMMLEGLRVVLARAAASPQITPPAHDVLDGRLAELDRMLGEAPVRNPLLRLAAATRERAIAARNRIRHDHMWPAQPPPEVAAAFPELARRSGAR